MTSAMGWKAQSAKGVAATGAYYWHKAQDATFAPTEIVAPFPPEIGAGLLPAGLYKGGHWIGGDISMAPRLSQNIGWLLWSFAGSGVVSGSGPYMHTFPGQADASLPEKWLSFRRMLPEEGGTYFGETFTDCKVASITINGVPGSLLNLRAGVIGLDSTPTTSPSGEGWAPNSDNGGYEVYGDTPITCVSGLELPVGTPLTTVNSISITASNNIPDPRQMLVVGSYSPHDLPVLQRTITIQIDAFWQNSTIYKNLVYNGGSAWSPVVYQNYSPFDVHFDTPGNLSGKGYAGKLGFWANTGAISWTVRGVPLTGGELMRLSITGVVNDISSGEAWRFYLQNGKTAAYS
jgi:hypothetical protein